MCLISFAREKTGDSGKKWEEFQGEPLWAIFEITSRCSAGCRTCYNQSGENESVDMTTSAAYSYLSKLKMMGVKQITISGGEPFESPHLGYILYAAHKLGFRLHLNTNGRKLGAPEVRELAKYGVSQVSLNYETQGDLGRKIEWLRDSGITSVVTIPLDDSYRGKLWDIFNHLGRTQVDKIRVWDKVGPTANVKNAWNLLKEAADSAGKVGYYQRVSYDPYFPGVGCPAGNGMSLAVTVDGTVKWCCAGDVNFGSILDEKSILEYKRFNEKLDRFFKQTECLLR